MPVKLPRLLAALPAAWLLTTLPAPAQPAPANAPGAAPVAGKAEIRKLLAAALAKEDAAAIRAAVELEQSVLGSRAGLPEEADSYQPVPAEAKAFTREEARAGMTRHFPRIAQLCVWRVGMDPTTLTSPLRLPAAVAGGMTAAARAQLDGTPRCLELAKDNANFLIWAQTQAGAGCYPFPAATGRSAARSMQAAARLLERAQKSDQLAATVKNGWIFQDQGDGGLQFDNGECGVAMLELYELTRDPRHLQSARQAADWALALPLCPNWNYNAFSVHLLAKAAAVTGEPKYLAAALHKALLGVLPGQLQAGPRAGRWRDAHNAKPAYHYIMMGALAQLAAVLPAADPNRAAVVHALALGLTARNTEIITQGIMTMDKAAETLLLVQALFSKEPAFLAETNTTTALNVLCRYAAEQSRRGKLPLGPRGWGMLLAYLSDQE